MNTTGLIGALGLGAGLGYMLDPERGRRRRKLARDAAVHALHVTQDAASATSRDARNRARGAVAEMRGRLRGAGRDRAGRGGKRPELLQEQWSPTARLLAGTAGTAAVLGAGPARGIAGVGLRLGGLVLALRALTNLPLSRLFGVGAGRGAVRLQKTIHVAAPVEEVFEFWSRYENFPLFMSHVRDVRRSGDGQSHWRVAGPAGVPLEWNTETTRFEPNRVLAWRTVEGSPIAHSGIVRFDAERGGTRIDIKMSYTPPAGAIGHAVAALLGDDPRRAMHEDLGRLKSLLEEGKTSRDGTRVRREDLA